VILLAVTPPKAKVISPEFAMLKSKSGTPTATRMARVTDGKFVEEALTYTV
jgi:hypothetical protein